MSRDDGFAIADVDVGYLDDAKIRALVRSTKDQGLVCRAIVAHLSVVLASWKAGELVALEDAAPMWLDGIEDLAERLQAAGLLERGRIRPGPWEAWFGPARDRRLKRRAAGAEGGRASGRSRAEASHEQPSSNASAPLNPSAPSVRSSPSVPSGSPSPSVPPARAAAARSEERRSRSTNGRMEKIGPLAGAAAAAILEGDCPGCKQPVRALDAAGLPDPAVRLVDGQLWHVPTCPPTADSEAITWMT